MIKNKTLGSILIVAGTAIGAGMLALPLISAAIGFETSLFLLIGIWALMTYTALLTLEVTLKFPEGANFASMSHQTLGPGVHKLTLLAVCGLFYSLLAAYFTGSAGFLKMHLEHLLGSQSSHLWGIIIMTSIFALLVSWKTSAVDVVNKILFGLKIIVFGLILSLVLPHVQGTGFEIPSFCISNLWLTIPVFFTSFGFHGSIPSIVAYMKKDALRLPRIFIIGSLIPLIAYIGWQAVTLGILSADNLQVVLKNQGSIEVLGREISNIIGNTLIQNSFTLFSELALLTSILGVSLGLFDFFKDILQKRAFLQNKAIVMVLTFLPPCLFAILYPSGFTAALSFAALFLAILAIFLPVLMAKKLRLTHPQGPYKAAFGTWGLWGAFLIGVAIVMMELWNLAHV